MSKTALIRLAPLLAHNLIASDAPKRELYDHVRLVDLLPNRVLIDHDETQAIGEVLELFPMEDTLPIHGARWIAARVRLHDDAPTWIGKGTPASISTIGGHSVDLFGWQCRRGAILDEISICSAATKPVEPLASVVTIQDEPAPMRVEPVLIDPPTLTRRSNTREQAEMDELRRRLDATGGWDNDDVFALVVQTMKDECRGRRVAA